MEQWTQIVLTVLGRRISHSWWGHEGTEHKIFEAPVIRWNRRRTSSGHRNSVFSNFGEPRGENGEEDYAAGRISDVSMEVVFFFFLFCQVGVHFRPHPLIAMKENTSGLYQPPFKTIGFVP